MASDTALREEFLDLLERDGAFRESVRRHLLTAELVELPERFAAFAGRVDEFMVEQQAINARVDTRFDSVDARLQAIIDDLGILKGHAAGRAARDHVETILDRLGLTYVTILDRRDLVGLLRQFQDIPTGERPSFFRADLVLEALDDDGATRYVAVEASYTANRRDSDRDVKALVEAGTVHWLRTNVPKPAWSVASPSGTVQMSRIGQHTRLPVGPASLRPTRNLPQ